MKHRIEDSFKKRYLIKLLTNFVGLGVSLVTQAIVPRALGPAGYGNYSFLTNFFNQITGFLNLNSSTAFYTKLSVRRNERELVGFYSFFLLLIGAALLILAVTSFIPSVRGFIWPGQTVNFIFLAAVWAFFAFVSMITTDMSDAYALTVKSESIAIVLKLLGMCVILAMFLFNRLSLNSYFFYQIFIVFFSVAAIFYIIKRAGYTALGAVKLDPIRIKAYTFEFSKFCGPLVLFSALAALAQIGDRWFVQNFSGSVKQGFYALAFQISSVCFLFTSAVMPLILREQSISFDRNDTIKLRDMFERSSVILYVLTAFFCCFVCVQAGDVLMIFGGRAYEQAYLPVALMCFYPVHQTLGQINGNFFMATGRVSRYSSIGICMVMAGFLLTFFILGPQNWGGIRAGATGLAFKMIILQFISVNVQLWYNTSYLKISYWKFLSHQAIVIAVFMVLSAAVRWITVHFMGDINVIIRLLFSGAFYSIVSIFFIWRVPELFSVRRQDVVSVIELIKDKLSIKNGRI